MLLYVWWLKVTTFLLGLKAVKYFHCVGYYVNFQIS